MYGLEKKIVFSISFFDPCVLKLFSRHLTSSTFWQSVGYVDITRKLSPLWVALIWFRKKIGDHRNRAQTHKTDINYCFRSLLSFKLVAFERMHRHATYGITFPRGVCMVSKKNSFSSYPVSFQISFFVACKV